MVRLAYVFCLGSIFSGFALPQGGRQASGVQALELQIQPETWRRWFWTKAFAQ
jgi:hypothetical protein